MANEQASTLSFSIQEAVWLNRGQEIENVLSLSLDPDISIHEAEDHVTVKGNLVLTGEYRPGKEVDEAQQQRDASLSEQVSFRSIEEVRISDEGLGTIKHPFPIDVTIPRDRIHSLDDVYVNVDGFDYDLPGNGCIELQADVSITGMRGEFPSQSNTTEQKKEEAEEEEERSFHYESVRPALEEEPQPEMRNSDYLEEEEEHEEVHHEPVVNFSSSTEEENQENEPEFEEPETNHKEGMEQVRYVEETKMEVEDQYEEEESTEEEEHEGREENALYLTKMLARDNEEEFSRLRMCIIQPGESIETISERYDIPVSQLMRTNQLNEERVDEGQILYIPTRKTSQSSS
ncbi:stage VI sporulation protein D [Alteribacter populi]|uniref:stage VI sporulation protein D n=1 Tax=Alteribacter populi TaxID=2011011 RepID=UPI000BBAE1B9|nr:stage VI sporulation protein D [Alteribacter populi]